LLSPHALPFAMARPAPPQPQAWLSKVSTVHWIHDPYSKCKSKAHYEAFIDDGVPRRASTAPHGSGASRANPGERERPRSVSRSSSRRSSRERAGSRPVSQQSSRVHGSGDSAVSSFSRSRSNGELADRYSLGFDDASSTSASRRRGHGRGHGHRHGHGDQRGFRAGGWVEKPVHKTQRELLETRKHSMNPHKSFDVDGDGVVSAQDYFLSSQFDVNKDGVLDRDEQMCLRKQMVSSLVGKFKEGPRVPDKQTKALMRRFTRDLDTTVARHDFLKSYNELYNKTAQSIAVDSSQVFKILQPMTVNQLAEGGGPAAVAARAQRTAAAKGQHSGFQSRQEMLHARRRHSKEFAVRQVDRRMHEHIRARNECGADIPTPVSWFSS